MTNIYIIRHGQTDSNVKNTYLGKTDIPLNDEGLKQARTAAERMADIRFDVVYSSPLMRAVQTAQELVRGRNLNIILNSGFEERNYGLFDNLTMEEIAQSYPTQHGAWLADWLNYTVPEGESAARVHKRTHDALKRAINNHKDENIAIVTHLGAARHMIANLLLLRLEDTYRFSLDNCKAAHIVIDDNNCPILKGLNV